MSPTTDAAVDCGRDTNILVYAHRRDSDWHLVDAWLGSDSLVLLGETSDHWLTLNELITRGQVYGPLVHDGRIAALCVAHGVSEFLTADRDFSRFPALATRNPLLV